MRHSLIATAFLGLLILAFAAIQPAQAICRSQATGYMALDTSPQYEDGPYDPCNDNINWSMSFYRTNKDNSTLTIIHWRILNQSGGAVIRREFRSDNYNLNQWYYPEGTDYVGSSTWHKLVLSKYGGPGGHFTSINLTVNYVAGDPTRPSGP